MSPNMKIFTSFIFTLPTDLNGIDFWWEYLGRFIDVLMKSNTVAAESDSPMFEHVHMNGKY